MGQYLPLMFDNAKNFGHNDLGKYNSKSNEFLDPWKKEMLGKVEVRRKSSYHSFGVSSSSKENIEEFAKALDVFSTEAGVKEWESAIEAACSKIQPTLDKVEKLIYNFGSFGEEASQDPTYLANNLNKEINTFVKEFNKLIDDICSYLVDNVDDFRNDLLGKYIKEGGSNIPLGQLEYILKFLEKHQGFQETDLKSREEGPLYTALSRLITVANSLPIISSGSGIDLNGQRITTTVEGLKEIKNTGELIQAISKKMIGSWQNVKGGVTEIAAATAAKMIREKEYEINEKVLKEFSKKEFKIPIQIDGITGNAVEIIVKQTPTKKVLRERSDKINNGNKEKQEGYEVSNKGDVSVWISTTGNDGARIWVSYALSVKSANIKKDVPDKGWKTVNFGTRKDLIEMAEKVGIHAFPLTVYAASRGKGVIPKRVKNPLLNSPIIKTTEEELATKWRNLCDQIVLYNLINLISGEASTSSDKALIFVIGKKVFSLEDIINKIVGTKEDGSITASPSVKLSKDNDGKIKTARVRSNFSSLNQYITIHENFKTKKYRDGIIEEREKAYEEVYNKLRECSISIKLNFINELLK